MSTCSKHQSHVVLSRIHRAVRFPHQEICPIPVGIRLPSVKVIAGPHDLLPQTTYRHTYTQLLLLLDLFIEDKLHELAESQSDQQ